MGDIARAVRERGESGEMSLDELTDALALGASVNWHKQYQSLYPYLRWYDQGGVRRSRYLGVGFREQLWNDPKDIKRSDTIL